MSEHPLIPKSNSKIVPPFIPKPKESLEAENARLKEDVEHIKFWNEQLKAENDLLRRAGDEVVSRIQVCTEDLWCSIHRWLAAKEGKQP